MPRFRVINKHDGQDLGVHEAFTPYAAVRKATGVPDECGPILLADWAVSREPDPPATCMRCGRPRERADWWGCNACVNRDKQEGLCRRD